MKPAPVTGQNLYHALRRAGVVLSADGPRPAFDAPAGSLTPALRGLMKDRKSELLAVVRGDYPRAALALVLHDPDPGRRNVSAAWFKERVAVGENDGGMSRGEAERAAYIALCRAVEGGRA